MIDKTPKEQVTENAYEIAKELKAAEALKQKIADQQSDQKKLQNAADQITSLLNAYEPSKTAAAKGAGSYIELSQRRAALQWFYDSRNTLIAKFKDKEKVEKVKGKVENDIKEKEVDVEKLKDEEEEADKQYKKAKKELDDANQEFTELTNRQSDLDTELKALEALTNQIEQIGPELTELSYYLLEQLHSGLEGEKSKIIEPKQLRKDFDDAFTGMRKAMSSYLAERIKLQNAQAAWTAENSKLQDLKTNKQQHILKLLHAKLEQTAPQPVAPVPALAPAK